MQQRHEQGPPDESLATEILSPACILLALLSIYALTLLLHYQPSNPWSYVLPALLLASGVIADQLRRRGRSYTASIIAIYTYGVVPLLSIPILGVENNPFIFLAALGILLAGLVAATATIFRLTALALLVYVTAAIGVQASPSAIATTLIALALLLIGVAVLSAIIGSNIRGTIEWALDAAAKSERREALLRATQDDLQQAIYQRDRSNTALQHANQELEAARRAAEAAYHSKSSFMAAMSHELRTPLNLIIGFSTAMIEHPEMYDDLPLPAVYRADLVEIRRSGQHLLGLINDILDLAKMEAGRLELQTTCLALTPLLEEMLKSASGLIKSRLVALVSEFDADLPPVLADEIRVRQVLLNLVSNACKFTERGIIALGARASHGHVLLWVRDSGIGIAHADQARVFGQFEQVETEESKRRGGTGLGLAICRWLVELHGGHIGVKSEPGRGSVFYFTLPLAASAGNHASCSQPAMIGGAIEPPVAVPGTAALVPIALSDKEGDEGA
jgi:signal transduction histidine kinase